MKHGRASLILWTVAISAMAATACHRAPPDEHAPEPTTTASKVSSPPPSPSATTTMTTSTSSSSSGSAVADDPWAAKPTKKDPLARPFLWTAEKDGKTTYLLGTIHIGIDAEQRMPDLVWKDFDAEPTFAMETDGSQIDASSLNRASGTLHDDLGTTYWQKLQDVVTPPVAHSIDDKKPAVAAAMMSLRGLPQTPPMDELFLARAETKHKAIVYLEPAQKQLALLDKWLDLRALKEMLDDVADNEAHSKEMLDAYVAGDEVTMEKLADAERADFTKTGRTDAEYDQQMNEMLYDRNASWIDGIQKLHAAGGGFVAVGAMHLIGKRSVLDLLAKAGFKITRVQP